MHKKSTAQSCANELGQDPHVLELGERFTQDESAATNNLAVMDGDEDFVCADEFRM
jgi:hypothetical protein